MPGIHKVLVTALILSCFGGAELRGQSEELKALVRLGAVDAVELHGELIYGLGCLSHGCPGYFLGRLERKHSEMKTGLHVLLLYIIPPGGKHPTAEQLDRYRLWAVDLRRKEKCDGFWGELTSRTKWKIFDPSGFEGIWGILTFRVSRSHTEHIDL